MININKMRLGLTYLYVFECKICDYFKWVLGLYVNWLCNLNIRIDIIDVIILNGDLNKWLSIINNLNLTIKYKTSLHRWIINFVIII